jgi:beta-lactamase superfamily II metal-dependent hydrolase
MDVGQGDGAVLISPQGEVVLFDNGVRYKCHRPVSYLQQLGVIQTDYHFASHYHQDHIGCTKEVLGSFPLQELAYDRGGSYSSGPYDDYVKKVGTKRRAASEGLTVTLDASSPNPVTIKVVALNGDGIDTTNENDLSLVALVRMGQFETVIGGDLSGYKSGRYEDIETSVALKVGQVEVYKVHHHCSAYSTNASWIDTTHPKVGIISVGDGNGYGHPAGDCLEELHNGGVKTYWTETGAGEAPDPTMDVVAGTIVVQFAPGASSFTVSYGTSTDTYSLWEQAVPRYAWSKKRNIYHYAKCRYVKRISDANMEREDSPPEGKRLHKDCPK